MNSPLYFFFVFGASCSNMAAQVIERSCIRRDRPHLQTKLPMGLTISLKIL